jgi:hypothetical protein
MSSSTDLGRAARFTALAAVGLACAGCNILGPAIMLTQDDRTPAAHQLDPKRTAVVFIDDRNSILPSRALRDRMAKAAEAQILKQKLLEVDLVSSESLQQVVAAERFSKPRSIAEIGRAVQADQVIYATVDEFSLSPDGAQHAPVATLRVKVIDSKNDTRLFPPDNTPGSGGGKDSAFPLGIKEKIRASAIPRSTAEIIKEQQELADELGRKLGELFFKHSSADPNSKVGR